LDHIQLKSRGRIKSQRRSIGLQVVVADDFSQAINRIA
jgi:hypothetical protein